MEKLSDVSDSSEMGFDTWAMNTCPGKSAAAAFDQAVPSYRMTPMILNASANSSAKRGGREESAGESSSDETSPASLKSAHESAADIVQENPNPCPRAVSDRMPISMGGKSADSRNSSTISSTRTDWSVSFSNSTVSKASFRTS